MDSIGGLEMAGIETFDVDKNEVQKILDRQEGHYFDCKSKRIQPAKLQNTFVAFANADGGDLYVGIEDHKERSRLVGFVNPEEANQLLNVLLTETNPAVEGVSAEFLNTGNNGHILHLVIPKSERVHYTSNGDCYQRSNAESIKIKGDQITQLAHSKGYYKFEETMVEASEIDDILDSPIFSDYLNRLSVNQDSKTFLRRNRLLADRDNNKKPNVACVLLFDKEPQEVLSTKASIRLIRMKTTSTDYQREQMSNDETLVGAIENLARDTEGKILDLMKNGTFVIDGYDVNVSYPIETVHEILVNAILHRDYSLSDDVHVTVFDDRIEIKSPGRLPGNVTVDNILEAHFSRNPNIVRMINKLPDPMNHDLGEGLNTAFTAMQQAGLVPPEITEVGNCVLVTIRHKKLASYEDIIMQHLEQNDWITNKIARKLTGEKSENKIKGVFQKLRQNGKIEPEDPNASRFKFRYRKVNRA